MKHDLDAFITDKNNYIFLKFIYLLGYNRNEQEYS